MLSIRWLNCFQIAQDAGNINLANQSEEPKCSKCGEGAPPRPIRRIKTLKLKAQAPENGWLEDESFPFGARPSFKGELLVLEYTK